MKERSVVIAGGGIIGLATAWELRKRDWTVTVIDPAPASGASHAAAGMLAPVSEVVWDQPALYPLMVASGSRYPEFIAGIERACGHQVGYLRTETLVCAGDSADRTTLTELMNLQHRMGMEVEQVTVSAARRMEPALGPGAIGAVHIPGDHQVDPRQLTAALIELLGPDIRRAAATAVRWSGGRAIGLQLDDGTVVDAEETLLAAGLATADIAGLPARLTLPLRPVWGDVIRMTVPARLQPLVTRVIRGVVQGRPVYIVPRADGTVVLGATSREDGVTGVLADGVHQLLRDAHRLVPAILECTIDELTARARPGSPDDVPMVGRIAPGLCVSTGYFRHGILLTALGSHLGAEAVCGDGTDPTFAAAVDPWRFSPTFQED